MKNNRRPRWMFALSGCLFLIAFVSVSSGQTLSRGGEKKAPIMFDEIGPVDDCELGSRFDRFHRELSNRPDYQGYVINYGSVREVPEFSIGHRERAFTDRIAFRNSDRSRITLVRGGYRLEEATELWFVPPRVENPAPSRTVSAPPVLDATPVLYSAPGLAYYDNDLSKAFLLDSVKRREGAERAEIEQQRVLNKSQTSANPNNETVSDTGSGSEDPKVAERESEDEAEHRYRWADVGLAVMIANSEGSNGAVTFYADDTRYDIQKLQTLIERGVQRMLDHTPLAKSRLKIAFGGYRSTPQVELWFVPADGKAPNSRPSTRCTEER